MGILSFYRCVGILLGIGDCYGFCKIFLRFLDRNFKYSIGYFFNMFNILILLINVLFLLKRVVFRKRVIENCLF